MSWRADACLGCKFYHADPAPIQLHPIPTRVCVLLCRASTFEHVCGAVALLPRRSDTRARFACCKLPSEARRRILTTANKGLKRGTAARQYDRDSSLLQICVERARMDTTPRVCNLFLLQIAIGSAVPVPTGCKCPSGERRRPSLPVATASARCKLVTGERCGCPRIAGNASHRCKVASEARRPSSPRKEACFRGRIYANSCKLAPGV